MKSTPEKSTVLDELAKLGKGKILNEEVVGFRENLSSFSNALESYIALKALEKVIEARLKAIKPFLHEAAEASGEQAVDGNKVYRTQRRAKLPDEEKLRALLETRKIELMKAFDVVEVLKVNPSKLQFLIDTGKLSADDVDKLHEVTWAIDVEPSEELKSHLQQVLRTDKKSKPERKGKA